MENSPESAPVVQVLPFPVHAFSVAERLRETDSWCWLDGEITSSDEVSDAWSYLGVASEVRAARRGQEREFLTELRGSRLRLARQDLPPQDPAEPGSTIGQNSEAGTSFQDATGQSGFRSGWVVAFGYEFGVALLGVQPAVDAVSPAFALKIDVVLAIRRDSGHAELRGSADAIDEWLAVHGWILEGIVQRAGEARRDAIPGGADARWLRSDASYLDEVERCRDAIRAGNAYVLCLTDTATLRGRFDPLDIYARLRADGGAIRGGIIVAGGRALVSASPERFLSVQRDAAGTQHIQTHPIKGTRPRGATTQLDGALADELAADPKEQAENLMIVDLMRNDLSRVCLPESVRTTGFQRVESHAHVYQLVSTVEGTLRPDADVFDAIESCFPGGSMTGAPKRRAVEILGEIEGAPRGLYAGCFGWIDHRGGAELAMTIRSIELRGEGGSSNAGGDGRIRESIALIGAGGGITIDSDPARELAEVRLKARAVLAALGASSGAIR